MNPMKKILFILFISLAIAQNSNEEYLQLELNKAVNDINSKKFNNAISRIDKNDFSNSILFFIIIILLLLKISTWKYLACSSLAMEQALIEKLLASHSMPLIV